MVKQTDRADIPPMVWDKMPVAWKWTLWQKAKEPGAPWELVIEHHQDCVFRVKAALARMQPHLEFLIFSPGMRPPE